MKPNPSWRKPHWPRRLWWWLLDEWCAASAPDWHGEFCLVRKHGLPHIEMLPVNNWWPVP